jgi:RNAse (barnase) inhibitor barstar
MRLEMPNSSPNPSTEASQRAPSAFNMNPLANVPLNLVQSIRAFRATELQREAHASGQHFLYARLGEAMTKTQVLATLGSAFHFSRAFGKNFDALRDCLTDLTAKAGAQPGFVVVLEQLPNTPQFDREARETLLDVFRDAADFWAEKGIAFRVFYSCQ